MKTMPLLLLLLLTTISFSQELDYCDYFAVKFSEVEYEGQTFKSCMPAVLDQKKDKAGAFFKQHHNRFEYILFKHIADYKSLGDDFPDSTKIDQAFCETFLHSAAIQGYFTCLTPRQLVDWNVKKETFTVQELMRVASRFFYCDAIDKADTTIQSHVCIGINGQQELQSARDYTLLEAFSGEMIFHALNQRKEPLFYQQFIRFKRQAAKEQVGAFTDFDAYLLHIRKLCYAEMEGNDNLEEQLLRYYRKNRDNLNFEIVL